MTISQQPEYTVSEPWESARAQGWQSLRPKWTGQTSFFICLEAALDVFHKNIIHRFLYGGQDGQDGVEA
jgi:hypothetical protein